MGAVGIIALALASVFVRSGALSFHAEITTSCGAVNLRETGLGCCTCENNRSFWYYLNFPNSTYYLMDDKQPLQFERNIKSWTSICGWASELATCMAEKLPQCSAGIGDEILRDTDAFNLVSDPTPCCGRLSTDSYTEYPGDWPVALQFYRRTCNQGQVLPKIQLLLDDRTLDPSFQCLDGLPRRNIYLCHAICLQRPPNGLENNETYVLSIYNQLLKCAFNAINESPCNDATRRLLYHIVRLQIHPALDDSKLDFDQSTDEDFSSAVRCSLGVFGETHLTKCWSAWPVTCSAPGEQTYVNNKYFTIKGGNQEVGGVIGESPGVTSLSSVHLTFSSLDGTRIVGEYKATGGNLPTAFTDTKQTDAGSGNDKVVIDDTLPDGVRFIQAATGTVLVLRQLSGNYFFSVRTSMPVVVSSTGLLVDGCPDDRIVSLAQFIAVNKNSSVSECHSACESAVNNPLFVDNCVLDCLATENIDLATNMSVGILADELLVGSFDTQLRQGAYTRSGLASVHSVPSMLLPLGGALLGLLLTALGC